MVNHIRNTRTTDVEHFSGFSLLELIVFNPVGNFVHQLTLDGVGRINLQLDLSLYLSRFSRLKSQVFKGGGGVLAQRSSDMLSKRW